MSNHQSLNHRSVRALSIAQEAASSHGQGAPRGSFDMGQAISGSYSKNSQKMNSLYSQPGSQTAAAAAHAEDIDPQQEVLTGSDMLPIPRHTTHMSQPLSNHVATIFLILVIAATNLSWITLNISPTLIHRICFLFNLPICSEKAVTVIRRVMDKLTGLDFYDPSFLAPPQALDVPEQVDRLIIQATANENLCLSFLGWCPFW